ncbi:tRNA uracil 4-sulfurtransferase ThiI [Marinimicrobium alkaliphilum]|uniref:tRNA uracil 4-sulfurtransferase ThiI n=1 Tax=Marinimicrobium alkaliphilum TaxID=2202654 RepID=UPI000DB9F08D|nr:tRNA uracil 4-sulfurtransferase ThiI [Marinimicrobium alkaliphilum]
MHFIVKVFPEIIIKSPPVRKRFIRQLRDNLRHLLGGVDERIRVQRDWEKIEVSLPGAGSTITAQVSDVLAHTPGIATFSLVHEYPLGDDLDALVPPVISHWGPALEGRTFVVRAKRAGQHSFTSHDVERSLGGALLHQTGARGVDLRYPEVTVRVEIKDERLLIVAQQRKGLGGYPLGTQEPVLSLVSGGFDSTVASYLMMKRGLRTHFCFFNLGGRAHEMAVKEISYYLWDKYGASHSVKFVTVPFEDVVGEILAKVDNAYMGVVLKRMMLRAAGRVAEHFQFHALVTGESIAQVSSQTLPNLNVIDQVTDHLVLRPLIVMDKGDIIDISRAIGTETFSAAVPEYCGVISVRPTTRARPDQIVSAEEGFDMGVLERALEKLQVRAIQDVVMDLEGASDAPAIVTEVGDDLVVDIRHPDEQELKPLALPPERVLTIPFYRLSAQFPSLDAERRYLLYCAKGVMSQLHAAHLKEAGHHNVAVYRP